MGEGGEGVMMRAVRGGSKWRGGVERLGRGRVVGRGAGEGVGGPVDSVAQREWLEKKW